MLKAHVLLFSLTATILVLTKSCDAKVSCADCPSLYINLTEPELNTGSCKITEGEVCILSLRIDYTNSNNSFANTAVTDGSMLILSNGEPQVAETTFIWLNELRVQRILSILCFAGTSGLDLAKQKYKEQLRPFNYQLIQKQLADLLYSPSSVGKDLTCANPSGETVSCPDGVCRSIVDGNGLGVYSSCIKKSLVDIQYGLIATGSVTDDNSRQSAITFTCNKPTCNTKETSQAVLRLLASAEIIPNPIPVTVTVPVTATATATVPSNMATKILDSRQNLPTVVLIFMIISKIMYEF